MILMNSGCCPICSAIEVASRFDPIIPSSQVGIPATFIGAFLIFRWRRGFCGGLPRSRSIGLPLFQEQSVNLLEVLISGYNRQRMLLGNRGGPNVILR